MRDRSKAPGCDPPGTLLEMRFDAQDYREAAGERFVKATNAQGRGDYLAAHLAAGLAVECMFRAYLVRVAPDFDARHDLSALSDAYLRRMPAKRIGHLRASINDMAILWRNNHRYCSGAKLRSHFNRVARHQKAKDMLKENGIAVIDIANEILKYGEIQWRD